MQDAQTRLIGRRDLIEKRAVGLRIGGEMRQTPFGETRALALARLGDACGDFA